MSKKSSKKTNSEKYWLIDSRDSDWVVVNAFCSLSELEEFLYVVVDDADEVSDFEGFTKLFTIIKGTEIPFSITPPQSAKLIIKE
jgi:predicted DNA-binding ArsR family transcriptional regulator